VAASRFILPQIGSAIFVTAVERENLNNTPVYIYIYYKYISRIRRDLDIVRCRFRQCCMRCEVLTLEMSIYRAMCLTPRVGFFVYFTSPMRVVRDVLLLLSNIT